MATKSKPPPDEDDCDGSDDDDEASMVFFINDSEDRSASFGGREGMAPFLDVNAAREEHVHELAVGRTRAQLLNFRIPSVLRYQNKV